MIKIHLEKQFLKQNSINPSEQIVDVDFESSRKQALINLILFLLPVGAMMSYEALVLPEKKAQIAVASKKLKVLQTKNSQLEVSVAEIKKITEDLQKLQSQTDLITKLSSRRMLEVKVLDTLQREIPEKVWLQQVQVNKGKMDIFGQALTEGETTSFVEALSKSVFLKGVSLVKSDEQVTGRGVLRKFQISANLEGF